MTEVEVKFLEVDQAVMEERLAAMGAAKTFEGRIVGTFFDFQDRRLNNSGCLLRLRETEKGARLAFKTSGVKTAVKSREEFELTLESPDTLRKILKGLGLEDTGQTVKHRTSYSLDGSHFEFDTYEGIPTYLEIEAPSEGEVKRLVAALGLSMKDARPWSWKDVFRHYGKDI